MKYDLFERSKKFAVEIILTCKRVRINSITEPLIRQLIKSATSIGANYAEADNAESPRDFKHKLAIAKKEAKETEFFIAMLEVAIDKDFTNIKDEAKELRLILNSIYNKIKK